MKSLTRRIVSVAVAAMIMSATALVAAAPASATDWGGNGSPTSCSGAYTVASQTIYGSRGKTAGQPIGQLELRWSSACYANWARVVLYGSLYSSPVNVEVSISAEGHSAGADDTFYVPAGGTTDWTPYIRLANSASAACVTGSISSDFDTLNYHTNGTSFCSY